MTNSRHGARPTTNTFFDKQGYSTFHQDPGSLASSASDAKKIENLRASEDSNVLIQDNNADYSSETRFKVREFNQSYASSNQIFNNQTPMRDQMKSGLDSIMSNPAVRVPQPNVYTRIRPEDIDRIEKLDSLSKAMAIRKLIQQRREDIGDKSQTKNGNWIA